MKRGTTIFLFSGLLGTAIVLTTASAAAKGGATLTVSPSEDLPPIATVTISGSGFRPLENVRLAQCSAWEGSGSGANSVCTEIGHVSTDAQGSFATDIEVKRTFTGSYTGGRGMHAGEVTYTCPAVSGRSRWAECHLVATQPSPQPRTVWHRLRFAP